jgi:hypothetical protein
MESSNSKPNYNITIDDKAYEDMASKIKIYSENKQKQYQESIKSDCITLSNAFNQLINNIIPNNYQKIINGEPVYSHTFKLDNLKHSYSPFNECGINTSRIILDIENKLDQKEDIGFVFIEKASWFDDKFYIKLYKPPYPY